MLYKKFLVVGAVAAALSISMNTASAGFDLGGIGKSALETLGKKALGLEDVDALEDKRQNMILNLSRAAVCYGQAAIDVAEALNLDTTKITQMKAALTGLENDRTNLGSMKRVGEATKLDKAEIEAAAKNLMDSGDQEQIDRANELIKKAKVERRAANLYKGLALRDATRIIASSLTAFKSPDLQSKLSAIQDLSETANAAKAVSHTISENHKILKDALKAYEKKNNIKDVSDKEAEKQMRDMGLE